MLISYAGGVAGRGTPNNPGPVQINGSASLSMGASATGAAVNALTWTNNLPDPLDVAPNGFFDLAPYFTGAPGNITASPGLPANVSIINSPTWRVYASSAATNGSSVSGVSFTLVPDALANFLERASDPAVMWWHNFDFAAEVNQFRWAGGYSGGNDPTAASPFGPNCAWIASGGADGGGYLRLFRSGTGGDQIQWIRPFNGLTGASNGRGMDDPCGKNAYNLRPDGSAITPQVFTPSDGSATTYDWILRQRAGWYGHASYANSDPGFDGTDFYYQVRVKLDPNRPAVGNPPEGKLLSHTNSRSGTPNQELVTYSAPHAGDYIPGVGAIMKFQCYEGYNYRGIVPPNTGPYSTGTNTTNWAYSYGWDTFLFHVTPGTAGGTGIGDGGGGGGIDTRLEVWAQHDLTMFPNEVGVYQKIVDCIYSAHFDGGTNFKNGWNCLLAWIYQNGSNIPVGFYQSYDQIIFSRAFIAAPQA